ncbi:MAG: prolipoprotein diacylglyceryl transferase [Planctomycetes bacterium]|nr:prolipoprotein diacylglyceryl transferase [Planctomycetota bacterium]MCP4838872.1 prolipoprotein diacylglyceryl transferase [Planctomycetota bacterium]
MPVTYFIAESYLHRLDPVAIPLSSDWGIRWYGLAYLAGFVIAWLLIRWMARTGRSLVPEAAVGDLVVYCVVGVLVGGRLGYAFFYQPEILISFSASPPWWELLAIHRGGMASHGGIIGVVVAMIIFARRHALPAMHVVDLVALAACPGLFLGRIANFINGELWGKRLSDAAQTNPPWWSVKYPDEVLLGTIDISSVQASVGGQETIHEAVVTAIKEGDPVITESIVPHLTAWWPSQLVQAISDGPVLLLILIFIWWKPRKPGIVSGSFLIAYGILRVITELVRQPDEGVSLVLGLQRGQLLSVGMILIGIILVAVCSSRSDLPVGGIGPSSRRSG